MNEKPLERLNYYNGQRLEAADFKTEQDYHMRTRRWLNKSLYSAGIARGLEVRKIPKVDPPVAGDEMAVVVSAGLALDNEGREIILLEEIQLEVCATSGSTQKSPNGNYLVVEYTEETIAYESGGCAVRDSSNTSKSSTNYGGPSRIQAQVKFSWLPYIPNPNSGQIVLARVELENCSSVKHVDAGIRKYIGSSATETVRQYALEGEREIAYIPRESFPAPFPDTRENVVVVGKIYFHVRGRQSNAVTLHLRAEQFSQLHYTELPRHDHSGSTTAQTENADRPLTSAALHHSHTVNKLSTIQDDIQHNHNMFARRKWDFAPSSSLRFTLIDKEGLSDDPNHQTWNQQKNILEDTWGEINGGAHTHDIASFSTQDWTGFSEYNHKHGFSVNSLIHHQGINDADNGARQGEKFTFVDDLQVYIYPAGPTPAPVNFTQKIITQLKDSYSATWGAQSTQSTEDKLGNGNSNHVLATKGTGAIRLDHLPDLTFSEGEYCIEFRINPEKRTTANGGKIHYNLYIE